MLVLYYRVTDVFGLELIETRGVGGLEDVFLDRAGIRASVYTLVMYMARCLLSLVIHPTLKQHLHPGDLSYITLHSRPLRTLLLLLLLFMLTLLPLA